MKPVFKKGFTVYNGDENKIVIVAPHSGPALESVTSRDDNSETVASLCWKELGGKLVISNISRKRQWGVDFNRDIPKLSLAIEMYDSFVEDKDRMKNHEYRKKYAWVAKDENDYEERLKIYQSFWEEVDAGDFIVLVHRAYNRMKAVPSIMDLTVFNKNLVNNEELVRIVDKINLKYEDFLRKVDKDYKDSIMFETKRSLLNLIRIYGKFDMDEFEADFKTIMLKDLKKVNEYADKIAYNRLQQQFTLKNYLEAVKNAVANSPRPRITVEEVFKGALSHGPKRKLYPYKGKIVLQVEPTYFLNFWHPHMAASIINDIIKEVKRKI